MECFVSQPNSVVLDIVVNPKGKGQECMEQVGKTFSYKFPFPADFEFA